MFGGTLSPVQIHKPQEILEPDCVVYIEIILLLKPLVTQSGAVVRGKKDVFCSMPVICFQYLITLEGQWNVLGKMRGPYTLS